MSSNWHEFILAEGGDAWKTTFRSTQHEFFGINILEFYTGESIPNWDNRSWLGTDRADYDGIPFDVLCDHLYVPAVSERMIKALLKHVVTPEEVQLLPIRLIRPDKSEIPDYSIMNVLHSVPALDLERSRVVLQNPKDIDPVTNRPRVTVGHPALRGDLLKSRSIVRVPELRTSIFVSQGFVDICRQNRFTGCTFHPVQVV